MEENAAGMGMNRSLRNLNYGSKRQELLEKLREMIIGGDFPPGSRFPSYGQLAARVNTGKATLQYVIERLKESGFLIGVERRGLFIPEQLPCFRNFAILLQDTDEHENRFWEKLFAAALAPGRDFHFIAFRGMRDPSPEKFQQLQSLLENRIIGGVLILHQISSACYSLLARYPQIPKAGFRGRHEWGLPESFTYLDLSDEEFCRCLQQALLQHGIRRLAIITRDDHPLEEHLADICRSHGIEVPSELMLAIPSRNPAKCRTVIRLLLRLPPELRPDGIFVFDDNLLDDVVAALAGAPQRETVKLFCKQNFPDDTRYPLPVCMIGFDCSLCIDRAVSVFRNFLHTGQFGMIQVTPQLVEIR